MIKGSEQMAAYFDDVIEFDSNTIAHVQTIRSFFHRLRKHSTKHSPPKA